MDHGPDVVALIGSMGAGKTTVGALLARRLAARYLDNDTLLRDATGLGPRELLARHGEPALRSAEEAALQHALSARDRIVLSVAAGTAADPRARATLAGVPVVWLRADPRTLAQRVRNTGRPWLGDDPEVAIRALDSGRRDAYAALATHVVDVDGRPPGDVVDEILRVLGAAGTSDAEVDLSP